MDELITELTELPYSGEDILRICDGETKVITYKELQGYDNIDEVLEPYNNVVILYEKTPNNGHWVCLIKHPRQNKIEFYDPYGFGIDEQFEIINKGKPSTGVNGKDEMRLSRMLVNSPYKIVENKGRIQKFKKGINSCGRHVGFRINMRDMPLNQYVKLLKGGKMSPDEKITYLTAFV